MGQSSLIKTRIKRLQSYMGINADGIICPATLTALENRIFTENHDREKTDKKEKNQSKNKTENTEGIPKEHQFEYALKVSQKGLDLIVNFEISSKITTKNFYPILSGPEGHPVLLLLLVLDMTLDITPPAGSEKTGREELTWKTCRSF